ncbi:MAG TPA: ABC transporter ATP-binding protein/permease [Firmicutes bacterium]|nr:ABC transporter ATP-binding protein/permease [Bacillota bacterium]
MAAKNKNKMNLRQQIAVMGRVLGYMLKNYKFSFFMVVVCILGSALATLRGTLFMQSLIDDYIVPLTQAQTADFSALAAALGSIVITYIIGILCAYAYNRIMVNVSQGTMRNLRIELFHHMESLPIRYFDSHAHGDIMSVYTNDVDTLRQLMSQSIPQIINSVITILTSFVSMLILDIPLTLMTLAMIGVMAWVTSKIAGKSAVYFSKQQKDLGTVNGYIEEMMEGQKVVKVFCHEDQSLEQFRKLNQELRESADKANTFSNITMPVNANIGNISYVLCAIVGAIFALSGYWGLTLGTLVSFLTLNKNSTQPVSQISQQMNSIVMAMAGAQRIFDLMDEPSEEDHGYVELVHAKIDENGNLTETKERTNLWAWKHPHRSDGTITYKKLEGDVTFDDVDFGYDDNKIVLHNIKLYATPGQKIAFVGSTGAGKTTITNLINRFYDIADGKIRYDGININKIKKSDLRRSLGMVLQDTHLFTGTVMENIRYGRLDATDEECIAAAKLANADGFIRRLPDGYQTILTGDGANLSQGQRQLLAIARAAVADPPVLILDEATSSIDTRTEALVQDGMDRLMKGRTTFVIAHRLSTVKNSDCIMVLEHGRIIERGSHEQLLEEKGRYYQLYTGNAIGAEE